VDIFPTLCELCDLDIPQNLDGGGLLSVMIKKKAATKDRAFGFWQRKNCFVVSMRTENYRISKWFNKENGQICQIELYDQNRDPNETRNIADQNSKLVKKLLNRMKTEIGN
jgi:arylsulfatase A-like enzyme